MRDQRQLNETDKMRREDSMSSILGSHYDDDAMLSIFNSYNENSQADTKKPRANYDKVYYNCYNICGVDSAARCKNVHCSEHPNYAGKVHKKPTNNRHKKNASTNHQPQMKQHHDDAKPTYAKKNQKYSQQHTESGRRDTHTKPVSEKSTSSNKRNFQNRYPRRSES